MQLAIPHLSLQHTLWLWQARRACGVAALDHKPTDIAVEHGAIVIAAGAECQKVLSRAWHLLAVNLQLHIAQVGVQRDSLQQQIYFPRGPKVIVSLNLADSLKSARCKRTMPFAA